MDANTLSHLEFLASFGNVVKFEEVVSNVVFDSHISYLSDSCYFNACKTVINNSLMSSSFDKNLVSSYVNNISNLAFKDKIKTLVNVSADLLCNGYLDNYFKQIRFEP